MSGPAGRPAPSASDGTPIDAWITIDADGGVTVRSGKIDIGTGVRTALLQIAAEELDVAPDRVTIVAGHTGRTPDENYTAGSRSLIDGGTSVRRAAASARRELLRRAAELTGQPIEVLGTDGGRIVGPDVTIPYADLLVDGRIPGEVDPAVPTKPRAEYRTVGMPVPRVEMRDKVTGAESFVTDVRLPGMRHGVMVRPPELGAHLLSVDSGALDPDVAVVRIGDLLGVVAATQGDALRAAAALRTEWSDGGPLADGSPQPPVSEVHDWILAQDGPSDVLLETGAPPVDATGVHRVSLEYRWPYQAHASIGPSCAVADVRPGAVTVYAAAQGVYRLREGLAGLLGVPVADVTVIHREGSGCYGHNGADDVAADAAILSREVGAPVRVQWTREQEFVWARKGPAMVMRRTVTFAPGTGILGWEADTYTSTHGGRAKAPSRFVAGHLLQGLAEVDDSTHVGGDRNAAVDYRLPHQRVVLHRLPRPVVPSSSLRALGAAGNAFANEVAIDEVAGLLGRDPYELRRSLIDDPRGLAVLDAVAERSGWGDPLPAGRGRGIAYARYENQHAYLALVAEVTVERSSGRVVVDRLVLAHDCGLIVNPDGVRQQAEGNLIQGLSRTLLEEVRWDGPRLLSVDWETYPILRFSELPTIEVVLVEPEDAPIEGAGEPATIVVAPAVANAVAAAVGARVRQIPLTPERVLAAIPAA